MIIKLSRNFIIALLLSSGFSVKSQVFGDLTYGSDSTLEVVTWNLENFPKEEQTTLDYVAEIVAGLDADIIALQEIYDEEKFNQMLANMDGYAGFMVGGDYTDLAFIYKTEGLQVNSTYEIFDSWSYSGPFPRPPLVIDFNFRDKNFIVINNHLKCCGDGIMDAGEPDDEETRRYQANNLLRGYINENFADKSVFIVGDMNDELTDATDNNVFQTIINDTQNFRYADMDIAEGSPVNWSYPTWPSHIDHIAITSELFAALENSGSSTEVLKIEQHVAGGWNEYESNITDHRPVGIKLLIPANLGIDEKALSQWLRCYPNPVAEKTTISFTTVRQSGQLRIFNSQGKMMVSEHIPLGQNSFVWNTNGLPDGIYFGEFCSDGTYPLLVKLVVKR